MTKNPHDALNDFRPIERLAKKATRGLDTLQARMSAEAQLVDRAVRYMYEQKPDERWLFIDERGDCENVSYTPGPAYKGRRGTWKLYREVKNA